MHLLEREALWKTMRVALADDAVDAAMAEMDREWAEGDEIYVNGAAESAARFDFCISRARERLAGAGLTLEILTALGAPAPGYRCRLCDHVGERCIGGAPADATGPAPGMGRTVPGALCRACREGGVILVLAYPCGEACGEGTMHAADDVPDACVGPMLRRASHRNLMRRRGYDPEGAARALARAMAEEQR